MHLTVAHAQGTRAASDGIQRHIPPPSISFLQPNRASTMQNAIVIDRLPPRVRWGTSHVHHFLSRVVSGRCSIVETEAQMEKMFALRYRIYIQELKKNLPSADHEGKRLPDPFDPGAAHSLKNRLHSFENTSELQG
jgi:hypothetical protein